MKNRKNVNEWLANGGHIWTRSNLTQSEYAALPWADKKALLEKHNYPQPTGEKCGHKTASRRFYGHQAELYDLMDRYPQTRQFRKEWGL